jgi:hypothetical protein
MFDQYLEGYSIRAICAWLDSIGVKPWQAKAWSYNSVRKILRNSVYIGRLRDKNGRTILRVPPIVKPERWHAVQDKLTARSTNAAPAQRGAAPFSGLVECAKCGARMTFYINQGERASGTAFRSEYYRCDGSGPQRSTCRNMVRADTLAEDVELHMTESAHADKKVKEIATIPGHGYQDEIAEVEADIQDLDMDDPAYPARHAELYAERARLKALPAEPDRIMERVTGLTVAEHWATLDAGGRRAFLLASKARIVAVKGFTAVQTHEWVLAGVPAPILA